MTNPITQAIDRLATTQERRWSHLIEFAEKQREAGEPNKQPASNS
jgi:hypothetical protein